MKVPRSSLLSSSMQLWSTKAMSLAYPFMGNKARLYSLVRADFLVPCVSLRPSKVLSMILKSLPHGWCKLNSDGAVKLDGCSLGGGIIRDQNGHFKAASSCLFENCLVLEAEAKALLHG
ncbi:hypothetical protein ACH5RR_012663 [Cinchona calisaya]|uniref:RNase H type-1 domain-containing protein n=1 Tax=Cinchona calisaya TaxID=153742 RepID=A0ABD3AB13_9GENT